MAECENCSDQYSNARADLGFGTCLVCGEKDANVERQRKAKCIAPAFNKGPMTYIGSVEQAKDIGR